MPKRPEDWLEAVTQAEKPRGIFKLFLGYAPGVGKTYSMLSEGVRRHARGEDVVIGVVETHGRKGLTDLISQLETLPRQKIEQEVAYLQIAIDKTAGVRELEAWSWLLDAIKAHEARG